MFKRIALFLAVNILVMLAGSLIITIVINAFGLQPVVGQGGTNYTTLMVICLVWGMVGSLISLRLSRWMAKRIYNIEALSPTGPQGQLVQKVYTIARQAGLKKMPEVGIYNSPEINAFATGHSKDASLVAVSSGLLNRMDSEEAEGVLGHEISHIANGDMVTMALLQGIINAFVMFFAQVATMIIDNMMRGDDNRGRGLGFFARHFVYMGFSVLFGFLAAPILMGFSRFREYRADAGSAGLVGKQKMIKALEALKKNYDQIKEEKPEMAAFQISSKMSFMEFFSSHPTLEKRINRLKEANF
jgi:heat shock protein HtpX